MSGKEGQSSTKPAVAPDRFDPGFLDGMDGRTAVARELKHRLACLTADLGGEPALSYQQRVLCRRVIWLEARVETMEAATAAGHPAPLNEYVAAVNALASLLCKLGLARRAKDVSLTAYIGAGQ